MTVTAPASTAAIAGVGGSFQPRGFAVCTCRAGTALGKPGMARLASSDQKIPCLRRAMAVPAALQQGEEASARASPRCVLWATCPLARQGSCLTCILCVPQTLQDINSPKYRLIWLPLSAQPKALSHVEHAEAASTCALTK